MRTVSDVEVRPWARVPVIMFKDIKSGIILSIKIDFI
jgi:hypothetical protein